MPEHISVLVIDDERIIRTLLQSVLRQKCFDVHASEDGPSGLAIAQKEHIDLVLLDWMIPGMDGMEVLSQLKHNEKTKHIPVFMLTSKEQKADIEQAVSRGADNYIAKPFNVSEIDVIIRNKLKEIKKTTAEKKTPFSHIFPKSH